MAEEGLGDANDTAATPASRLDKAGDFAKYLTALAAGALVFSAELLKKDYVLPDRARHLIIISWILLTLGAFFGLVVLARIPMMMQEGTEDLEDFWLKWPFRLQQIFLFVGIIALGLALIFALWKPESLRVDVEKPPARCQNDNEGKFAIVNSAPHILGKAPAHEHTFLLNRETGQVWEMTCDSENRVRFRSVEVGAIGKK